MDRRVQRVLSCAVLCLASCGEEQAEGSSTVEIFSWWVAPGEAEALDALVGVHVDNHPEVTVVNAAATDSMTARDRLEERLAQGMPPDLFQQNVGVNLTAYVRDEAGEGSLLEPVDSVLADARDAFPAALLDLATVNGQAYGVPLNVHRLNVLYYNTGVLTQAGVAVPTTIEELEAACVDIEATGVPCIAMPARDGWTNVLFLVENVLVAQAGPDFYEEFLTGNGNAEDPAILDAAMTYLRLYEHSASDSRTLAWDAAVDRMAQGQAAFTVMGDWAKGFLISRGLEPGVDFGSVPFPGSDGTFVFTSDAFVLPRGAPSRNAAAAFLETCASTEGQIEFNLVKGSIPARTDVDGSVFDPLGQQTIADFASGRLVPATSGLGVEAFTTPVGDAIGQMLDSGDPMLMMSTVAAYYDLLQQ